MKSKKVKSTKNKTIIAKESEYESNPALNTLPDYLTIEGVVYEKIRCYTEMVSLDLDDDVLEMVEKAWRQAGAMSKQDFIRKALTELVKNTPAAA